MWRQRSHRSCGETTTLPHLPRTERTHMEWQDLQWKNPCAAELRPALEQTPCAVATAPKGTFTRRTALCAITSCTYTTGTSVASSSVCYHNLYHTTGTSVASSSVCYHNLYHTMGTSVASSSVCYHNMYHTNGHKNRTIGWPYRHSAPFPILK